MTNDLVAQVSELVNRGNLEKATALLRTRLNDSPEDAWAHYALGSIMIIGNNYADAEEHLNLAVTLDPLYVDAYDHLGVLYARSGAAPKLVEATFKKALEINPAHIDTLINLGHFSLRINRNDIAEEMFSRANQINPDNALALNNLGAVKVRMNRRSEAIPFYRRALELTPGDHICRANYLSCLRVLKRHDELIPAVERFAGKDDIGIEAFSLFSSMRLYGMWKASKRMLKLMLRMIDRDKNSLQAFSFMEINMVALAVPEIDNQQLFTLHKLAGNIAESNRQGPPYDTHPKAFQPARRWRVGYVSPDFRNHVVSSFLRGLINERDKDRFEIYCYSNTKYVDKITEEYKATADVFVDVTAMSDRELAERIHADGIHFLVDLTGYTQDSRTDVMCYRPAPVQIMYMGYPYTSGIREVDYFISDPYLDGPENGKFFVEKHIRLPESFTTFGDLHEQEIADAPPCKFNKFITFGSLNNIYKINEQVIEVWAKVLNAVPDSRIIINHPYCEPEAVRKNLEEEFSRHGVTADRIEFVWEKHPGGSHLRYYNDIDIALDTFPLTGGTTTIDAIWMGVPVITLVGDLYHQRLSYSILKNAGIDLADLIAFNKEEFVAKAVSLAGDPDRISHYRRAIPDGLKNSVLCDPVRLTRHVESAYLDAWDMKYPDRPVSMEIAEDSVKWHQMGDKLVVATPDDLNDFSNYVLQEQPGWYEPEWPFVQRIIKEGMHVVDLGAEYGQYAVPLAYKVGRQGKLRAAVRFPHEAAMLEKGFEKSGLGQADIFLRGDRKLRLDIDAEASGLHAVDFVRLHVASAKTSLFSEGDAFFKKNSPLVMFALNKVGDTYDLALVPEFETRGYNIYRLVPGLNCLIPFKECDLDVFLLNLFACKPDRAEQLELAGDLIGQIQSLSELPGIHIPAWQEYLSATPYAQNFISEWADMKEKPADWEVYWMGLNLFALAQDKGSTPAFRYACLQSALGILSLLAQNQPRLPRLITMARVLADLGKREQAVHLLNHICVVAGSADAMVLDEPLVPLTDEIVAPVSRIELGKMVFANLLQQREKLRAFSSYFTGQESLPVLEMIRTAGYCTPEIEGRIALIRKRYNL